MKWWEYILCVLTVIAAIVLLSLFFYYVSPCQNGGSDIVSALSILVTILIGWQVVNAIEMRTIIRSVDSIKEKLNRQGLEHENKTKSLEWLISALHGETYKRGDFENSTGYFLHCLDVIGCFIKSGTKLNNSPFNRSLEQLEAILQDIKKQNNEIEIAFIGAEKNFVREWYHKAIYMMDTIDIHSQYLNEVKSRLANVYDDYITLTKDVKIVPKTQRRIKGETRKKDKNESNNIPTSNSHN